MKPLAAKLVFCCIFGSAGEAAAQTPPPQNVLHLSASASTEIVRDLLAVTFSTQHEAPDAAAVQAALQQALEAALVEARKMARPGQVEVEVGNFTVHPRHDPKGRIAGWIGSAEMTVQGRDMTAIAQLSGRITTMSIARVGYGLSRQKREEVEAEVVAQAIARYRAKAAAMSRQFGFDAYTIRELNVATDEPHAPVPTAMMARASAGAEQALPVEPGRGTVSATVSGSVQMK